MAVSTNNGDNSKLIFERIMPLFGLKIFGEILILLFLIPKILLNIFT